MLNRREDKSMSHQEIENELKRIQKKTVESNPYLLDQETQDNLKITLNTLFYILESIKKNILPLGTPEGTAMFHLENHYSKKENSPPVKRQKNEVPKKEKPSIAEINESLKAHFIMAFIETFNLVEKAGAKYVKEYCLYFSGECLDGRTRSAFDYAWKLSMTLSSCIQEAHTELLKKWRQRYFPLMAQIICTQWGKMIDADSGANGIRKQASVIDEATLYDEEKGAAGFIKNILIYELDNTFLDVWKKIPATKLPIFFNVILNEKRFMESLQFNETEQAQFDALIYPTPPTTLSLLDYALKRPLYHDRVESLLCKISPETLLKIKQSPLFEKLTAFLNPKKMSAFIPDNVTITQFHFLTNPQPSPALNNNTSTEGSNLLRSFFITN